ncbi:indole-3-glycerol phosphate synthase-domain-containing protein [Kalaharituber pfeilii]|nr:indole-3-glycerol phosphate synthase-domain-containing protein [Kalaharituber pfeilii]
MPISIHANPTPDSRHEPLPSASNVVMIDNYDSFTWNVYQFLTLEGANVTVHRNDKITLQEVIDAKPTQLVVSPGPGHPDKDAGISKDCIRYFAGKIPVLGVCMGEQCIFSVFGGDVKYAGEIVHGKTSQIKHDGRGIYKNVPQGVAVTRYHSLAGTHATLPKELEVTSWTDSGIIMGVRHKEYTVEGVQYHPESILTEEGRLIIRNFLEMKGGTWKECYSEEAAKTASEQTASTSTPAKEPSILDKIYAHRRELVAAQKLVPSQRPEDLETLYSLGISPPPIDFPARLRAVSTKVALMAEIKRASPSKGDIDLHVNAALQARTYALSGAAAISVLTEPKWFKGSIDDLRAARQAVEGMPNRPAILRKEFIFDEYQILEARLAGADTVLLIVKMLDQELLERLYNYSKSLGMEPLVEVNNKEEMERALSIGSKVIGVNNRDLHCFKVDLGTTSGLVSMVDPNEVILCALSGIATRDDVARYEAESVGAILVGETLMRAGKDVDSCIRTLLNDIPAPVKTSTGAGGCPCPSSTLLVKICGTRTVEAAKVAVESGADLVGMILVPGTKRSVDFATAKAISEVVHSTYKPGVDASSLPELASATSSGATNAKDWFTHGTDAALLHPARALLIGVFRDQPLNEVLRLQKLLELDIVQLHGSEPQEWARLIPCPVIKKFSPGSPASEVFRRGYHAVALLDSGAGGTGELVDIDKVKRVLEDGGGVGVLLAGGLDEKNVRDVVGKATGDREGKAKGGSVIGVDVSSGVETDGRQDLRKIRRFVHLVKGRDVSGM